MNLRFSVVTALLAAAVCTPASAAVTFTFAETGGNVVLTGAGSLNLTGANIACCGVQSGFVNSGAGALAVGGPSSNVSLVFLTGNAGVFGTGSFVPPTTDVGQVFGMNATESGGYITVFQGYTSGSALSGTTIFANRTLASLGLTAGTYTYSIPNDTVTVVVPGAIPEPATWAMMLAGFGAVGFAMRRRPKANARLRLA